MRASVDALGDTSTLVAVLLGGLAATLGSFAAVSFERYVSRREAERDAALMFGEHFHALCGYLNLLRRAHARGDPFGPITVRMLRAVRREFDIYDRNRERLMLVRDGRLRLSIANLMAQSNFSLDRILDHTEALAHETSEARRAELAEGRDQAFEFLVECAEALPGRVKRLGAIAHTQFAAIDSLLDGARLGDDSVP